MYLIRDTKCNEKKVVAEVNSYPVSNNPLALTTEC